ncbi:MAG: gp53-like domain-containing protein [Candidatus Binataceae bacterium]
MATLFDVPAFSTNEVYEIQQTDPVEGAAAGAAFDGIGISNQPHQQLANRTALLKQRQDSNIGSIGVLQAFMAGFTGSLQTNGYLKLPIADIARGAVVMIMQWGFYSLPSASIGNDTQYSLLWPLAFPNGILVPPLATNYYVSTGGMNTVASVVSYSRTGATFVLDVPGALHSEGAAGPEVTNGFSWLAIGF